MDKLNVDCLSLIFNQMNKNSLYTCLLVNREWCRLIVPILWKNYSWTKNSLFFDDESEEKLFNTILSCLPSSSRQLLSDNDIKLFPIISLNPPLFNYISFCKFPEAYIVEDIVKMVYRVEFNGRKLNSNYKRKLLEREIYKLFVNQCKNIKELRWKTLQPLPLFPGALACFSQLDRLYIHIDFVNSNNLNEMAQICKNLNELYIYACQDLPGLISLIDAQRNLKSVTIYPNRDNKGACEELSKALTRKGNTIHYLYLDSISLILPTFFTSLINLKKITIRNVENYEDIREEINEFQKYLTISEFPDLQSLSFTRLACFKELAKLIEKTKGNILDACIYNTSKIARNTGMLIKAIANNCPKIKKLRTYLEQKDFIHVKLLLLNCRHLEYLEFKSLYYFASENLEFKSLYYFASENDNYIGDELLDILTKFSPNSLTYLTISGSLKYSIDAFERFFESCRERNLDYFGITYHDNDYITENHEAIVGKYIEEGVIRESDLFVEIY